MNLKTFTVDDAHALAASAHAGQVDKQGRDYYTAHLLPVAREVAHLGADATMAALLHDIVEDTDMSLADLEQVGVPARVVKAVDAVTRRPGETYADLITRACADALGVHIKLADNTINISSNPDLAARDLVTARRLLVDRYLPARDRLIAARAILNSTTP